MQSQLLSTRSRALSSQQCSWAPLHSALRCHASTTSRGTCSSKSNLTARRVPISRSRVSVTPQAIAAPPPLPTPSPPTTPAGVWDQLKGKVAGAVGVALVAAVVGIFINQFSDAPCALQPAGCEQIPYFMKVPLIATHLFAFMLVPASMYTFYKRAPVLEQWGAKSPFNAVLGLSFLMVSICGEIGWHVSQEWYYQEEYMILNFAFYFFLATGTSLWAIGVQPKEDSLGKEWNEIFDKFLVASPVLMAALYALGAAVTHTKLPIYLILTGQYAILTQRLYELMDKDKRVFLFPFFSVGVNLFFISLLDKYESDKILNPLFHILHDAAGTEMGIALITALVWFKAAEIDPAGLLGSGEDADAKKQIGFLRDL